MAVQKKSAKGRLDKWYKLAKEKGYRARAAFKLIQLNKKYHVLEKSKVLLDLCAAPGSWCQVASEVMPVNSIIIGVDLAPIKPIPRCITFQSDITTDKCRATIRQHLKSWKADTVLHDGAPNVGTAWVQDAFSQAELVLQALKLATEFLAPGGTFITKIFRSKDYNSLLWVFNQLFGKVEATKPPSSRNVSAEIFVVCRNYKAPKRLDPRFLDPKSVFEELADPTPNNEAKVFNPEKKKRKRDGYEEGNYTQFKEAPVFEFIETNDPIAMLGSLNKLSFQQGSNGDVALAALSRMAETTQEIRECCSDLRVLGRKEFKLLLRWRLKMRDKFELSSKSKAKVPEADEEVAEIESMDEEMQIQEELQREKDRQDSRKKKERRRENEKKQKEIIRMQMNMTTPTEIGLDQAGPTDESMFSLKAVDGSNGTDMRNGKMHMIIPKAATEQPSDEESESDEEEDRLESQLDSLYEEFKERKNQVDPKYRAKKARREQSDEDFQGFSDREVSSDEDIVEDEASNDSSDDEAESNNQSLFHRSSNDQLSDNGLSRRAAMFFEQDLFKNISGLDDLAHDDSGIDMDDDSDQNLDASNEKEKTGSPKSSAKVLYPKEEVPDEDLNADFEVVKMKSPENGWDEDEIREPMKNGRPDVDIITAEAMTLAHEIATGKRSKHDLTDDGFNKYSHRDVDGLPDWFLDDENQHSRPQRPISAAGAAALKEKLRALNARPIKKVREAKARKKFKAAQRLEKLKKKSALLIEDGDMSEKDKAQQIARLMAKATKKKPRKQVKVVVARGGNRGISGRPRGTKGKYKMVDARLKKDVRAAKRIAKRK